MEKVAAYDMPRRKALTLALVIGVGLGLLNRWLDIEFIPLSDQVAAAAPGAGWLDALWPWLKLAGKALAALVLTALLHEGLHGGVARLCGRRPVFGFHPPLVYITFQERVPRGAFILIALAPLVVLDLAAGALFAAGIWPVFTYIVFMINSIGAVGDVWIVLKLLPHARGSEVQDTKTGIEVWGPPHD